jgi:protein-S-isoprenylcysteine O-methyltransferase Ste14
VLVPEGLTTKVDLQQEQRTRKRRILLMAVVLSPLLLFTASAWQSTGIIDEIIEAGGALLIIVAIFGRVWCTLYIGGRKRSVLVVHGPYSVVRHPLYLFTLIGLAGLGAQTGSLILMCLIPMAAGWPLAAVARREDQVLTDLFGDAHVRYVQQVPAFLPKPNLWQSEHQLSVQPRLVERTFVEASLLLLAIPVAELVHAIQLRGMLPVLLRLR